MRVKMYNSKAVGRVRAVADMIQTQTGGDLFSILTSHIENPEDYDVIFVGYPNWLAYHNLIQCTQA